MEDIIKYKVLSQVEEIIKYKFLSQAEDIIKYKVLSQAEDIPVIKYNVFIPSEGNNQI